MSNYTLLLIDYEPRSIERMRRPLEQAGIRVEVATDGAAGLAAFEQLQPDAVIVEAMLPKRHGFEVCQEIKKTAQGKRTPVIVTTGVYKGRRYRTQAMHIHGADEYLEKPLTDEQIVETIRKFLADRPARASEPPPPAAVAKPAPPPAPAPPAPVLELDADAADIFEIIDESLSIPKAAAPPPPKPAQPTTARSSVPMGDLSDDEISARLDALLPSDPSLQTEVSWEGGHAVGHLEPSAEARAAAPVTAVVEAEAPTEFAPMPDVGALPEDIAVDPRNVDLEPPRPVAQVVPFDASRPSRRKEAPATPVPPRAAGTAAVAPVVEIAPAPRVAPAPAVEVPLTESYESPKRGLPWWIWVVAAAGLATGVYFAFFRAEPTPANAIAAPVPAPAPVLPQASIPESPASPTPSSALPVEPAATTPPQAPVPETPKPVAVAPKVSPPAPAPPSANAPTGSSAPTTPSALNAAWEATHPPASPKGEGEAPAPSPSPAENLEDPSLAVAPVAPVVTAPVATRPATRAGDLVSLNDVDIPPMGVQKPAPQYTSLARTRRQEGTVVMELLVDETGRVADVRLVRGIAGSDLNDAAMEAARSWVYKPAEKDGVPVRVWRPEQVRFKL